MMIKRFYFKKTKKYKPAFVIMLKYKPHPINKVPAKNHQLLKKRMSNIDNLATILKINEWLDQPRITPKIKKEIPFHKKKDLFFSYKWFHEGFF